MSYWGDELMIGETRSSINPEEPKAKIALRDAFVVFLLVLFTQLLAYGYPPQFEAVYISLLTGAIQGLISYMHAIGIEKPKDS